MIEKEKFQVLNYVKKEDYTGSMDGMRYMLRKKTTGEESCLEVLLWPEPFCYGKTPKERKLRNEFPLSQHGLEQAIDWMNGQYESQTELWGRR